MKDEKRMEQEIELKKLKKGKPQIPKKQFKKFIIESEEEIRKKKMRKYVDGKKVKNEKTPRQTKILDCFNNEITVNLKQVPTNEE